MYSTCTLSSCNMQCSQPPELSPSTLHSDKVAGLTIALSSSLRTANQLPCYRAEQRIASANPHRRHSCPANTLDCPPACRTFTSSARSSRPEVGNRKSQELAYLRRDTLQLHARNKNAKAGELPRQNLQTEVSHTFCSIVILRCLHLPII
jgi:hypothetical protein